MFNALIKKFTVIVIVLLLCLPHFTVITHAQFCDPLVDSNCLDGIDLGGDAEPGSGSSTSSGGSSATTNTASHSNGGNNPINIPETTGFSDIATFINNFSIYILPLSALGFAVCIIASGYVRMFSLGNSEQEKQSVNIAKYGAIGFAMIFFADLIVLLLGGVFKIVQ